MTSPDAPIPLSVAAPVRITRRREWGWRMPAGTVYVGRAGKGSSRWGNPYIVGKRFSAPWLDPPEGIVSDAAHAVFLYRQWLEYFLMMDVPGSQSVRAALAELRGKNLACWCKPGEPCHADVLLELANQ